MRKNLIVGLCITISLTMTGCGKETVTDNIIEQKEQAIEEIESRDQEEVQATGDNYHIEDTEEYQYGYQEGYEAARQDLLKIVEQMEDEFMAMLDDIENDTYVQSNGVFTMWDELGIALQNDYNRIMLGDDNSSDTNYDNETLSPGEVATLDTKLERYFEQLGDGTKEPETEEELIDMIKHSKFGPCEYYINAGITRVIPEVEYKILSDNIQVQPIMVVAKGTDKNYDNNYTIRFKIDLNGVPTIKVDGVICNGMTPSLEEQVEILEYLLP